MPRKPREGRQRINHFFFFFLCRARKHWLIKNISFERRKRSFNERNPLDKNVLTISNSLLYTSRPMLREISLRLFRKLRQASEAYEGRESMKENMERYPFDRFHLVFQLCCQLIEKKGRRGEQRSLGTRNDDKETETLNGEKKWKRK